MGHAIRTAVGVAVVLLLPACTDPTVAPAKGDFILYGPGNGAIGVAATPTFTWQESFSVETPTYTIQVSTDPAFSTFAINQAGVMSTSFTPGAALSDGTLYYWQVLAVRSTGTVVSTDAPFSFTTFSATPGPFTMIAPTNALTGVSLTPTFSWNPSAGAVTYTLEVALDVGFSSIVISQPGLTSTMFTPGTSLTASTAYFWRVTAVSTNSTVATGAPFAFTTGSGAPANSVTLSSPTNGATAVSRTPTYSWTFAGTTPASYTIQVTLSTDSSFTSPVVNQTGISTTSVTPSTTLGATTTYIWRVQSFDSSNAVLATSSSFSFTTGP
jgi:hypothetical protein